MRTINNRKRLLPGALLVVACGSPGVKDAGTYDAGRDGGGDSGVMDAGTDGGSDAGQDAGNPCPDVPFNDAGQKCSCEAEYDAFDGGVTYLQCCDPDLGNPCAACCFNPREADGGRQYYPDSGSAVCYC